MVKVLVLWVGIVIALVLVDGSNEFHFNETTTMSFLDAEAYGVSLAARNPNALMVGLTLIRGADAKGAGTFFFYYYYSIYNLSF
jgi:hypothetical protein